MPRLAADLPENLEGEFEVQAVIAAQRCADGLGIAGLEESWGAFKKGPRPGTQFKGACLAREPVAVGEVGASVGLGTKEVEDAVVVEDGGAVVDSGGGTAMTKAEGGVEVGPIDAAQGGVEGGETGHGEGSPGGNRHGGAQATGGGQFREIVGAGAAVFAGHEFDSVAAGLGDSGGDTPQKMAKIGAQGLVVWRQALQIPGPGIIRSEPALDVTAKGNRCKRSEAALGSSKGEGEAIEIGHPQGAKLPLAPGDELKIWVGPPLQKSDIKGEIAPAVVEERILAQALGKRKVCVVAKAYAGIKLPLAVLADIIGGQCQALGEGAGSGQGMIGAQKLSCPGGRLAADLVGRGPGLL